MNRFPAIIGEYHYINPNTQILKFYSDYSGTNIFHSVTNSGFDSSMDLTQLKDKKEEAIAKSKEFAESVIAIRSFIILEIIRTGKTNEEMITLLKKTLKEYNIN